jgi:hypothetical protein
MLDREQRKARVVELDPKQLRPSESDLHVLTGTIVELTWFRRERSERGAIGNTHGFEYRQKRGPMCGPAEVTDVDFYRAA